MSGIATQYAGARFRSRLEARWAVMFDLLGWNWDYEPIDLDGYIPDFILMFKKGPQLVEIKPSFSTDDLLPAAKKIERSGWKSSNDNGALILGGSTLIHGNEYSSEACGLLRQTGYSDPGDPGWWDVAIWAQCLECDSVTIEPESASFISSCCAYYDGGHQPAPRTDIRAAWNEAGSRVQWRPPR